MRSAGYTLIELLVVISIIALISIVGFVNFKNFSQEQVAVKAQGQVQTILRLAQSNATASVVCGSSVPPAWTIELRDRNNIYLKCLGVDQRTYALDSSAVVDSISGMNSISGSSCASSLTSTPNPITTQIDISFTNLNGVVNFTDSDPTNNCLPNSTSLIITLKNNNTDATKNVIISKGGAINVQ